MAPTFPSHPWACCLPLTLPLPPSSTEPMPPFTSLPCLTAFPTLSSSPLPLPCLHLYYSNPLCESDPPCPSLPAPLLPPVPAALPPQADLAHSCPDGSEPGQAEGPGRSRGLVGAARPSLDGCVGSLHHRLHPPQQWPLQQQGPALFPLGE